MSIVAIITDFGDRDWYVASMKATIFGIAPDVNVVDITHSIGVGDIEAGAFVLSQCWNDFADGTVFLGVVDPGVGTERPAVCVRDKHTGNLFVGPDNGLISYVMRLGEGKTIRERFAGFEVRRITNNCFYKELPSYTFHGRDVFAPVAARLAGGWDFEKVGPSQMKLHATRWPEVTFEATAIVLCVLYVDSFGNLITNLSEKALGETITRLPGHRQLQLRQGDAVQKIPLVNTFGQVKPQQLLCYVGSGGLLEIAVNGGSAAEVLGLNAGQSLTLEFSAS